MSNDQSSIPLTSAQDVGDLESRGSEDLRLPAYVESKPASRGMHPAVYIINWIFLSNLTIVFNKWIIDSAGFRYPILLTCWHLVFAVIATQILARTTKVLDSRHDFAMTPSLYARTICPIGLFYSASLACSNLVYLYLSVAFIQMLKSAAPITVLFVSWIWRVEEPSLVAFVKVCIIVVGVALASVGEVQLSILGLLLQIGGTVFEAIRLVMIQVLLGGSRKMDPLVGLYYYAPICALITMIIALPTEIPYLKWEDVTKTGVSVLFANAFVAFLLNVASVSLIGRTSSLVMTLSGVLKNVLLIGASVLIWGTAITAMQAFGYSIALAGLIYYSFGNDSDWLCRNIRSLSDWASTALRSSSRFGELRKGVTKMEHQTWIAFVGAGCFVTTLLFFLIGKQWLLGKQ